MKKSKRKTKKFLNAIKRNGIKNLPELVYIELLRLFTKITSFGKNKVSVMKEDWDYLIVLDACRYDTFKEIYKDYFPNAVLKKKISKGAHTKEWAKKNFKEFYKDVVYVSANPLISTYDNNGNFKGTDHFKIEPVWDYGWDDKLDKVPTKKVNQAALKTKKDYEDKRMIIHYLQPHEPWIGKSKLKENFYLKKNLRGAHIKKPNLSKAKKAYKDNLKLVLKYVSDLVKNLDGKIIITADHGESFGEKLIFEHFSGVYTKSLTEVPWLKIKK